MTHEEYIKSFLKEIASQKNRGTAAPYFYVIRTSIKQARPVEDCDEIVYYCHEYGQEFKSRKDFISEMTEEGMEKDEAEEKSEELAEYGFSFEWKESGMFLTESDAENHLKKNHYHYSEKAHTYVKHCWRAPGMENFFVSLFNYFGVDKGNLDLRLEKDIN